MSAIRSSSNRAEARKNRSTPYARAVVNKVFRFLGFVPADDVQEARDQRLNAPSDTETDASSETNPPSENHCRVNNDNVGSSTRHPYANASRDPLTTASSFNVVHPDPTPSIVSAPKLERSTSDQSMQVDNKPTQRFSFTYSVSGSSSFSSLPDLARNDTPTSSARKKLDRNPNGIYRWEGAGSAKHARPRNRYASPAFGASPARPSRVVMKDSAPLGSTSFSDNKRRRVDEGSQGSASDSSRSRALPFPLTASPPTPQTNGATAPTTPRTNGVPTKTSPLSSSSRLRTPAKPTAPVVPSPLRQAWSDPASPSSRDDAKTSSSPQAKQTKTANFMAELIKETIPPKKPDLSNPYQTASPVGKVGPPRRGTRRTRATGKATVPAKDQSSGDDKQKDTKKEKDLSEYSPQAIIEATLPKGSKRSRPPAHFENPTSSSDGSSDKPPAQREPPVIVETRKQVYTVEEPDADEDESPRKKSKPTLNGNGFPSSVRHKSPSPLVPEVTVEEISDVDMDNTQKGKEKEVPKLVIPVQSSESPANASSPTSRASFGGFKPSSIPKEPSKLRFSFQAEGTSAPASPAPPASAPLPQSTPPSLPKSDFKFSPPSGNFEFKFKVDEKATSPKSQPEPLKQDIKVPLDLDAIKAKVRAMNPSSLPVFSITLSATTISPDSEDHVKARNIVNSLPGPALPVFEFGSTKSATPFSFGFDASKPKASSSTAYKPSPPKLAKPMFMGGNSSVNLPKMPASVFTFADSAKSAPPVQGFNFAAAGMKPPTVSKDTWACSLCGVSNSSSAAKCIACETPSPQGASTPAPASASVAAPPAPPAKGFDFAAAGFKLPTASKGTWACSLCGLSSPDSASKCVACETPR